MDPKGGIVTNFNQKNNSQIFSVMTTILIRKQFKTRRGTEESGNLTGRNAASVYEN